MVEKVRLCIVTYRVLPQTTSCTEVVLTNQKRGGFPTLRDTMVISNDSFDET
jgi:hypothetical protein